MISTFEEFIAFLELNGLERYIPTVEKYSEIFTFEEFYNQFYQTEIFRSIFESFEQFKTTASQTGSSLVVSDGMTVVIGLVVVFATLIVLTGIFYLFGFIMDSINKPKTKKAASEKKEASAPTVPAAAPAPVVQSGIPGEVVAVIAAAVASMAPEGKRYALKSVSRKDAGGRSAWAAAGVADNTRPF